MASATSVSTRTHADRACCFDGTNLATTGASHGADAFRVLATRFRYIEPVEVRKPPSDRTVLMADKYGRVGYVRDDGAGGVEPVNLQDAVKAHIKRRKLLREEGVIDDLPSWKQ